MPRRAPATASAHHAGTPDERRPAPEPAEAGCDLTARALRLGAFGVGCPLIFTPAGSVADAGGARSPALPERAFEAAVPVRGSGGELFGTLRAVDLASRPQLGEAAQVALGDAAALIAGDIEARDRIGQVDHVTGLPNRKRFERDFPAAARACSGDDRLVLVTLADARHYNEILRALGHLCAENFVRRGAEMVRAAAGATTLYHVSVLSLALVARAGTQDAVARAIVAAFETPVFSGGLPITTRIGVGLTRIEPGAPRPAETLRAALAAAQDSRRAACGFAHYDRRSDEAHVRAFGLLTDLDVALKAEGQLSLVFQPRIDLATGAIAGAEALIRWTHPTLGPISPAEFIPLAETTALMGRLTDWVLARACRRWASWRASGLDARLSVNIPPSSLHDAGFPARIAGTLDDSRIEPSRLEFELTEGTFTSTEVGVRAMIDGFRAAGITIAIDDFGTGYSNLDYLTRLPADVLKIDRSFMGGLESDERRRTLVRTMIDLSHRLGFRVVAEGVETAPVYGMLADWGCDEGQGYFMSRPLAPDAFAAFAQFGRRSS